MPGRRKCFMEIRSLDFQFSRGRKHIRKEVIMGFFEDLTAPIGVFGPIRQELSKNLATASGYLGHAEMVFHEKHKIAEYRSKIDMTVKVLNAPESAASVINDMKSVMQIAKAVSDLRKIRYLHNDPDRAAYAFGR